MAQNEKGDMWQKNWRLELEFETEKLCFMAKLSCMWVTF